MLPSVQRSMDGNEFSETVVIGAGMAGLSCATALKHAGREVRVFDKGRGPGGRMATRRVEHDGEQFRFDHGAQYFTARDPRFQAMVAAWHEAGVVAHWPAAGEDACVGAPAMNAPIRHMAESLDVVWSARIESVARDGHGWALQIGERTISCKQLLVAIPPEQVRDLLRDAAPDLAEIAASVRSLPCWAVLVHFAEPLSYSQDIYRDDNGPISWAARNGAKPERDGSESWVIHASPERSAELLELEKEHAADILLADFFATLGPGPVKPHYLTAHRWRYAMPQARSGEAAIWHGDARIGLAGDWLHSPRVEGAFISGRTLADKVLGA